MTTVTKIPKELQESIRDVLDKRVKVSIKRLVKMEIRVDKIDNRVLAFSPCRLFIMTAKVPTRLEHSFHFLDIQGIESKKSSQLTLTIDGKDYKFMSVEPTSEELDHMIIHLGISLRQIFPSFPLERLIVKVDIQPEDRHKTMQDTIKNMDGKEVGPCGGFTTMYQCMCDYHSFPFRDEVAWDVDTIYLSHDSRELRIQDFDHLLSKDLIPIISALEHNIWFKSINATDVKLSVEAGNEIIKVMRRNAIIEELNLSNTGIKGEFVQKLATALLSNSGTQLQRIDLSNNVLDDKSMTHLLGAMKLLPCGLTSLDLSRTGISTRCLNKIGEVFSQSSAIPSALTTLNLSDNGLKGEDFPMMCNFLAQPNSITVLDLSSTDCTLDSLCDPLLRGCPSLTSLKVSRTMFTHKRSKEPIIPHAWKQLFASACFLESVDLSNCKLPAEALKELLLGIGSNRNIKELVLDISGNDLGVAGVTVMVLCIPEIQNLKGLNISNNSFDSDLRMLLPELSKNLHLKRLSIGRNFSSIKPKYIQEVMNNLVQLIQNDASNLEFLSIADSRLKIDASYIINALGSNETLLELDISGNAIGDPGARMLAKALQINTKLKRVVWDKNNVTAQGFEDVAEAMQKNMTMKQMPFPVNDASLSIRLYPERTEAALQKIESYLQRNHCPRRFAPDQAYRLQQGFLISSTQQILDRKIVQVQDTINALNSLGSLEVYAADVAAAENLLKDAEKSRQLLPNLQDIALTSQSVGNPVDERLQESRNNLQDTLVEHLKKTLDDMLECTTTNCPAIMNNEKFQDELKEGCKSKLVTRKDFMQEILEGASADIYNHTGEINLAVASLISDNIVDEIIDSLTSAYKTLSNHLSLHKSGAYKDNTDEADGTTSSKSLVVPEKASPRPVDKRKSMINRKTRPQSTVVFNNLGGNTVSQPPTGLPQINAAHGSSNSINSITFDDLPSLPVQPLNHVVKSRPRREKVNRPTRPVLETSSTDADPGFGADNGIHPSYASPTPAPAPSGGSGRKASKSETQTPVKEERSSSVKGDNSTSSSKQEGKSEGSKKWSPMAFMRSRKDEKHEKEKPEKEKKSHSFNLFKKKEDKKRPSVTETPNVDATNASKESSSKQEPEKSLPSVKEDSRRPSAGSSSSGEKTHNEPAKEEKEKEKEKPSPVRPPREKQGGAEKVALLPQLPKKVPTLAKEEDTTLPEKESEEKEEEKPAAEASEEEKKEEKPAGPKLPPGAVKIGGLAALGNRNLLDQLKEKQVQRSSHVPTAPTASEEAKKEEKPKPKEIPITTTDTPETNNNNNNNNNNTVTTITAKDSAAVSIPSESADDAKAATTTTTTTTTTTVEEGKTLSAPSAAVAEEESSGNGKKEPSPSPPQKSSPTIPPKMPLPAPRVAKRPLSTSAISSASIPLSTGETEQKEGDRDSKGPIARPRPPPPLKPRPPLAPRPRKSTSEDSTDTTSSPASTTTTTTTTTTTAPAAAAAPAPPSDAEPAANPAETADTTAVSGDGSSDANNKADPGSSADTGNSSVVYESATLKLSVKDKIKRLSQSTSVKATPGSVQILPGKERAKSLPKDSKLPKSTAEEDASKIPAPRVDEEEEEEEKEQQGEENQEDAAAAIPKTPTITPPSPVTSSESSRPTSAEVPESSKDGENGTAEEGSSDANTQPPEQEEKETELEDEEEQEDEASEETGTSGEAVIMV